METKLHAPQKLGEEPQCAVYRRYRDFEWILAALKLKHPACVIPPLPPKQAFGNWYTDESESMHKRK